MVEVLVDAVKVVDDGSFNGGQLILVDIGFVMLMLMNLCAGDVTFEQLLKLVFKDVNLSHKMSKSTMQRQHLCSGAKRPYSQGSDRLQQ